MQKSTDIIPMNIPPLGMGTWGMGGRFEKDEDTIQQSIDALRTGLRLGFRLIDTAELYGQGLTETIVGKAIQEFPRKDIFLVTKVSREHLAYEDVHKAIAGSLKRLGTDYVDLYLVHKDNPVFPLSDTMRALEEIADKGLARFIGVSNFSDTLIQEAQSYLDNCTIAANQIEYNFMERSAEKETIPYCKEHGIVIIAQRPFAKGELLAHAIPVVNSLAKKYGKTGAQIMLNWIITKGMIPIPKAMDESHLRENMGAIGWNLEDADMLKLDAFHA